MQTNKKIKFSGILICKSAENEQSFKEYFKIYLIIIFEGGIESMKVRKAIIPAAGLGTRFLPATKALPKLSLIHI